MISHPSFYWAPHLGVEGLESHSPLPTDLPNKEQGTCLVSYLLLDSFERTSRREGRALTNESLGMGVLHSIIVAQLMFDRVEDEPTLFPSLEQGPPFVQVALMGPCLTNGGRLELVIVVLMGPFRGRCV